MATSPTWTRPLISISTGEPNACQSTPLVENAPVNLKELTLSRLLVSPRKRAATSSDKMSDSTHPGLEPYLSVPRRKNKAPEREEKSIDAKGTMGTVPVSVKSPDHDSRQSFGRPGIGA